MKTKEQLETIALKAKFARQHASDAMGRAESALSDAQNKWGNLRKIELDAKRAVDEWKEPDETIVPVIPFV